MIGQETYENFGPRREPIAIELIFVVLDLKNVLNSNLQSLPLYLLGKKSYGTFSNMAAVNLDMHYAI